MSQNPPAKNIAAAPERWWRQWARALAFLLLLVGLALAFSGFIVTFFGAQTYHWRAFDLQVRIHPALLGSTRLRFLPLGEVRAATHKTPVALEITLMNIAFDEAKQLITNPPPREELEREFRQVAHRDLNNFALRQIVVGGLGALLSPLFLRARRLRYWLLSAGVGSSFVAVVFYLTLRTFSPTAFEKPTYTGSLQQAEWIITLAKDAFNKVEALSQKLKNVASNINTLYARINAVPRLPADGERLTVLHISDIHNNPAAVAFVRELIQGTQVDLVIDTGDLTDFGFPLEAELSKGIAQIKTPYVFVAGNHDSPAILEAVRANPNAVVLEGKPMRAAGLNLLGSPDPSAARAGANNVDTSPEALQAAGEALAVAFQTASPPVDILCVHNPRQAEPLIGKVRLILCGHVHRNYIEVKQGTILCNAGTTGAAGARYLDRAQGVPLSASLLCFSRPPNPRLLYIDRIVLDGALNQYSISRETFDNLPLLDQPVLTGSRAER